MAHNLLGPKNLKKRYEEVGTTMMEFHPQSPQAAVDKQYHMISRNERWMMRLKAI